MKKLIFSLVLMPNILFAQQTITSVQNGNASNPLTWDCLCFPTPDDDVIINHAVTMDVDWIVNAGGSITVNTGKSFLQSGYRSLLIDGSGSSYINNGTSKFFNMAYTNGASGTNSGSFSITQALYFAPGTSYNNSGLLDGVDSLLTEGTFTNTGTCYYGNFYNTGTVNNSGAMSGDSVGNGGTFNSTGGYMYFNAFGNTGDFTMSGSGFMDVANDWANIADFTLGTGCQIFAHEDFFNGDSLGGSANLHNNGTIEVTQNFLNGFLIDGSGNFCVGGESYNVGSMNGTFDFCDNTGGSIDLNTGTIAGTVTFCSPGCFLGINENQSSNVSLFPNPTEGIINIDSPDIFTSYKVFSVMGNEVSSNVLIGTSIDLNNLNPGTYFIQLFGEVNSALITVAIK